MKPVWRLIILLSLGGFFEFYDLFLTAYLSPALIHEGIFQSVGFWGLPDQAFFAAATFAGLFVGTLFCAPIADRHGRRIVFTFAMLWYSVMSFAMAWQKEALLIHLFRFLAGVGIGIELVTIDTFIAELAPSNIRGKAYAVNQAIQFTAVPIVALLSFLLLGQAFLGLSSWRLIVLIGALGAVAVWWLRRYLPESPRWLIQKGRRHEAQALIHKLGLPLDLGQGNLARPLAAPRKLFHAMALMWRPPYLKRTIMLVIFNFCQTVGFYGFSNWLPAFMASHGHTPSQGLLHALQIAPLYPLGPLLCLPLAERFDRKWLIAGGALGTSLLGLGFALPALASIKVLLGAGIVLSNNLMSFAYHAYQAELYPTSIRSGAVGFVYSWSRLSTVFTSLMIGFFLNHFGVAGAFAFIAANMLVVAGVIALMGPPTRGRSLEEISPELPV